MVYEMGGDPVNCNANCYNDFKTGTGHLNGLNEAMLFLGDTLPRPTTDYANILNPAINTQKTIEEMGDMCAMAYINQITTIVIASIPSD